MKNKKQSPNYPVSYDKIKDILSLRNEMGENFPKFAVFILAYNAESTLRETINRIPQDIYDILECLYIIDDFSEDETYKIGNLMRSDGRLRKLKVFRNPRNYGYGGNQKIGFRYAIQEGFDYIILLHGDGQYAPEFMPNLIWPVLFEGKKVVFGTRMARKWGAVEGGMPLYKLVGNIILTTLENIILKSHMSEFHSGYRLYSTQVLTKIPFELNTDDFNFDTQVIIQCFSLGVDIHEVPIPTYYGNEICYVNGLRYAMNVMKDVLEFRLYQLHIKRCSRYTLEERDIYRLKKSPYSSHSQIAGMIRPGSKVLDIGCGTGFLADLLLEGIEIWGIDQVPANQVSPNIARYFRHNLEKISDLQMGREFDRIIIGDVIEHVRDTDNVFRFVRRSLKSDGRLIISTGNIAIWFYRLSLLMGRFKYGPRGILDDTHVKLYTLDTFKDLIHSAGLKILSIRQTPIPFELVFFSRGRSRLPKILEWVYWRVMRFWPRMFAYQFIIEAEISSPDFGLGEGELKH
jgi:glycosyltransferase involved in cell wall biosynthesis